MKSLFLYFCLAGVLTEISLSTRKRKEARKDKKKEGREEGRGNKEEINKKKRKNPPVFVSWLCLGHSISQHLARLFTVLLLSSHSACIMPSDELQVEA